MTQYPTLMSGETLHSYFLQSPWTFKTPGASQLSLPCHASFGFRGEGLEEAALWHAELDSALLWGHVKRVYSTLCPKRVLCKNKGSPPKSSKQATSIILLQPKPGAGVPASLLPVNGWDPRLRCWKRATYFWSPFEGKKNLIVAWNMLLTTPTLSDTLIG